MSDELKNWFGLQERLETAFLKQQLERLRVEDLARWGKKLSPEEIAPAVAAHVGKLLAQLTLSLRDKDRATWAAALDRLAEGLKAAGHPLEGLVQDIPVPPFRQLLEIVRRDAHLVGSSESVRPDVPLGVSALLTGSSRSPSLITQIGAAFESHWEDPAEFEPLAATDLGRLKEALATERDAKSASTPAPRYGFFDLRPYGFQQEILDEIEAERRAGIGKHLVIAATGTGKTMVAAFDYRRYAVSRPLAAQL
jgi:hypothetical protein